MVRCDGDDKVERERKLTPDGEMIIVVMMMDVDVDHDAPCMRSPHPRCDANAPSPLQGIYHYHCTIEPEKLREGVVEPVYPYIIARYRSAIHPSSSVLCLFAHSFCIEHQVISCRLGGSGLHSHIVVRQHPYLL
jgi:hypothetical protein